MKNRLFKYLLFVCTTGFTISFIAQLTFTNNQIIRNVSYEKLVIDESVFNEFDSYAIEQDEEKLDVQAYKEFDISIFEEFDLVSFDEEQESVSVEYQVLYVYEKDTIFLNVSMGDGDEYQLIDSIPGLVSLNNLGEEDVLFSVDGDLIWLSELTNDSVIDQTGWFKNLVKKVTNKVVQVASDVVKALEPIIKPVVKLTTYIAINILGDDLAAAMGAYILNMNVDDNGIYYANFNCWQQYFGYTDLYDVVFDAATNMRENKIGIDINEDDYYDYMLWGWKGDYLNLGAGAELGIYERWEYSDEIWKVNKSLAMNMTIKLEYNREQLFFRSDYHWWITGFQPDKKGLHVDNLTATFTFVPSDRYIRNKLISTHGDYNTLSYSNTSGLFTIEF